MSNTTGIEILNSFVAYRYPELDSPDYTYLSLPVRKIVGGLFNFNPLIYRHKDTEAYKTVSDVIHNGVYHSKITTTTYRFRLWEYEAIDIWERIIRYFGFELYKETSANYIYRPAADGMYSRLVNDNPHLLCTREELETVT